MSEDTIVQTAAVAVVPFPIPGATPDGISAQILNSDPTLGANISVLALAPGTTIPAHYHLHTTESHYVLAGEFINAGITYGPGAFFTHAPGTVHGPHATVQGCTVLTIQPTAVDATDFHPVDTRVTAQS